MDSRKGKIGLWMMATAMLLLAASCSSKKPLATPTGHADYQWMTAKMNGALSVENGEVSFTGTLRMRRDSAVWISAAAMLGMESVRTLVTQDSVIMVNRLNQTYLAEPLATVIETFQTPSLRELQNKLLGNGTDDHVELQWGPYTAKIRYSDIQWDEPTTFPIKINKKYERVKL